VGDEAAVHKLNHGGIAGIAGIEKITEIEKR